jgi:nitrogen fixation NifU-like protein
MRFTNPSHAGVMSERVDVVRAMAGSRSSGASVCLSLKTNHGRVEQARFRAYGCPHFIAAADMLAEWCEARSVTELPQWQWQAVGQALEVPTSKRGRLLVLETALNSVINQLRTTQAAAG